MNCPSRGLFQSRDQIVQQNGHALGFAPCRRRDSTDKEDMPRMVFVFGYILIIGVVVMIVRWEYARFRRWRNWED